MNHRDSDLKHIWHPYTNMGKLGDTSFPVIEAASGIRLRDTDGREYLDGISSWWCVNLGHSHPYIVNSVAEQLVKLQHSITGGMSHLPVIRLSKKLADITPPGLNRFYYCSDGASAVEAALRMAIQHWWNLGKPERKNIISIRGGYHGDTLGAVGVGFIPGFHKPLEHVVSKALQVEAPFCFHCPLGLDSESCSTECFRFMEQALSENAENTAAVIAEPVCQGAAGVRIYPPSYVTKLSKLCERLDILLILDEIAVGFGRTGAMFASELAGVTPDILVMGKGLTAGYLPMSAVAVTDRVFNSFIPESKKDTTFYHGHTFSGNPLACAAASAALDIYCCGDFIGNSSPQVSMLHGVFAKLDGLSGVHRACALGWMSALEVSGSAGGAETAGRIAAMALQEGLLIRPLGSVLYLWPPLVTETGEMTEMLGIFSRLVELELK